MTLAILQSLSAPKISPDIKQIKKPMSCIVQKEIKQMNKLPLSQAKLPYEIFC